jgi:hypothetical protein
MIITISTNTWYRYLAVLQVGEDLRLQTLSRLKMIKQQSGVEKLRPRFAVYIRLFLSVVYFQTLAIPRLTSR